MYIMKISKVGEDLLEQGSYGCIFRFALKYK